jgi:hypothetical protein
MFTAVLAVPVGWFVDGLVVWYVKFAGVPFGSAMEQLVACAAPILIIVAKAVTTLLGVVVRAFGNTAATSAVGAESVVKTRRQPSASLPPTEEQRCRLCAAAVLAMGT